jgi:tetratricopeptide (TPR) repeat protein
LIKDFAVLIFFAKCIFVSTFALSAVGMTGVALAQNINLLPKYGTAEKTAEQKAIDVQFLKGLDDSYNGDRKKASIEIAQGGWQFLAQGNLDNAMVRFNQAWLADNKNGLSIWGMGVVLATSGQFERCLPYFAEADGLISSDIGFAVDYAKVLGIAGAELNNAAHTNNALARFAKIHGLQPDNTLNLQNWSITLFYNEKFKDAWDKLKLAEATTGKADIDPNYVAALQAKMPRP